MDGKGFLLDFGAVFFEELGAVRRTVETMVDVLSFVDGEREGERSDNHVERVEIRFPCR